MKIPVPSGTAQNAQFFELYHGRRQQDRARNLTQNDKWITYASKASGLFKEELEKNRSVKVPR